jgi:outer membrane lipase/esterase
MLRLRAFVRSLLAIACAAATGAAAAGDYTDVFFLGDSLTDPGNLALVTGSNPGQVITGNTYIPSQPYGSQQFTNGDVWAKAFAAAIGLPLGGQPALLGGGNYAFGGARIATDAADLPPSLSSQENLFLASHGGSAPAGALYVVAGGGNDARDAFAAAMSMPDPSAALGVAAMSFAQSIGSIVDGLQGAGARHIVVWDVPDLGLAPAVSSFGAGASFLGTLVSQTLNSALAARLSDESGVSVFDVFGLQSRIVADPASFGLVNVTDACGATSGCDPSTFLFWDGIHPTSAGHAILAREMLATVAVPVPEPAELVLMLAGLALIGGRAATLRSRRGRNTRTSAQP